MMWTPPYKFLTIAYNFRDFVAISHDFLKRHLTSGIDYVVKILYLLNYLTHLFTCF